eukprot:sb/3471419/
MSQSYFSREAEAPVLNSIFLQISDQVGTKQPPCIIRIPSKKTQQTAAGLIFVDDTRCETYDLGDLISSVRRYGMWNMILGSLFRSVTRYEIRFLGPNITSQNHVPHPVSSHTANELPRIISFVSRILYCYLNHLHLCPLSNSLLLDISCASHVSLTSHSRLTHVSLTSHSLTSHSLSLALAHRT